MVPSSCHGVVFAAGNGKCQEMLSLRIGVCRGSRASHTPANSTSRSMSERILSGATLRTATVAFTAYDCTATANKPQGQLDRGDNDGQSHRCRGIAGRILQRVQYRVVVHFAPSGAKPEACQPEEEQRAEDPQYLRSRVQKGDLRSADIQG